MPHCYDIVGDVHGRATALHTLLQELGYRQAGTRWTHEEGRELLFVGDLVDVGPQQRETLSTVRSLMDSGIAQVLMGNHEFNAICYATPDPLKPGEFLRAHGGAWGRHNREQHQAFLEEFEPGGTEYREWIDWMLQLPLWLETEHLRVVHACWNQQSVDRMSQKLSNRRLAIGQVAEAQDEAAAIGADVTTLLKGTELLLPQGVTFQDRSGHSRDHVRYAWWRTGAKSYGDAVLPPPGVDLPLWKEQLPPELITTYTESKPTFFGHYCLSDTSPVIGVRTVCLDTCAARGYRLTAYRWDGETTVEAKRLVSVPVTK